MSRRNQGLSQNEPLRTLTYVYDRYLSRLFTAFSKRGLYIDARGGWRRYPASGQLIEQAGAVYRPNHGLAHNVRVTSNVSDVIAIYADKQCNLIASSRAKFLALKNSETIKKLE